jgi:glycosyltransferase involved in cell wall biosynthesis
MYEHAIAGVAVYVVFALLFALATYIEGWGRRDGWDTDRIVGLLACSVWPLVLIGIAIAAAWNPSRHTANATAVPGSRRVLVINSFTNTGGSQQATLRLARQLKSRGYDAEAWFIYKKGALPVRQDEADAAARVVFDKSDLSVVDYLRLPFRLLEMFRRFRPDTVITFLPFASVVAQPLALLGGVRKRVASHRVPGTAYSPILRVLDRLFGTIGVFTNIICVSDAVRDSFASYPEAYKRRLAVIHNGIEWVGARLNRRAARTAHQLADKNFCVLGLGRLCQQKNFGLAIEAVAKTQGTRLLIAGDGPDRASLEQQARESGASDRVVFLGSQPADHIADLFAACDAFILPSLFEGQSNALLEAMHAGRPILASDIPMQRETLHLKDGKFAGFLLPLDQPDAWSQALACLRDDAHLRAELATRAGALVSDRFSLRKMVDKFETVILA